MAWLRVDEDIDTHPQIADAAEDAWLALPVFEAVLRIGKRHGRGGRIGAEYVTPRHVARRLCFPADRSREVGEALLALVVHGALDRDGGDWIVPGWSHFQADPGAAERVARGRTRKNASSSYGLPRNVTVVTPVTPDSTGRDGTGRDGTGRDEEPPPPPVPGGACAPTVPLDGVMESPVVFDAVPLFDDLDIPPLDAKPARNGAGLAAQVAQVYAHWRSYHPTAAPRLPATAPEARKAAEALKRGHTVESLSESIDGYHTDPWHLGANDRGKAYLGLGLILRDEAHITDGIEMFRNPGQGRPVSERERHDADVLARFVARGQEGTP